MGDTVEVLMKYIAQEFGRGRVVNLKQDDDLLRTGILDSLAILQLVTFVEERFDVCVPDEDVVYENFCSVESLAGYLERQ